MARPTARVLALLELLQDGGTHTVASLAARLEVDERTVRRYVEHLLDLDVPVRSVRGRYGGYRLAPGHRMPPLMLTEEEALASFLGLLAVGRIGLVTSSDKPAESAAAKIRRVLPQQYADRIDALMDTMNLTLPDGQAVPADSEVLLLLAQATQQRRPVAMSYRSGAGQDSARTIRPYGLVASRGRWFLIGADLGSGEIRTFRVDLVALPKLLEGTFEIPAGFDPAAQVLEGIATAPRRFDVRLRVKGSPQEVLELFPQGLVVAEPDEEGWSRVRLTAERLDWVPAVLASLGRPFEVQAPDELGEHLRDLAGRLLDAASTLSPGARA
jgi:predicted DNA-binding transcriptional regulator YafY